MRGGKEKEDREKNVKKNVEKKSKSKGTGLEANGKKKSLGGTSQELEAPLKSQKKPGKRRSDVIVRLGGGWWGGAPLLILNGGKKGDRTLCSGGGAGYWMGKRSWKKKKCWIMLGPGRCMWVRGGIRVEEEKYFKNYKGVYNLGPKKCWESLAGGSCVEKPSKRARKGKSRSNNQQLWTASKIEAKWENWNFLLNLRRTKKREEDL